MEGTNKCKQKLTVEGICLDIDQWPQSWAGDLDDIVPGEKILIQFKLFLQFLIDEGRAKSTIKNHSNYLWSLGGEIIRDINTGGHNEKLYGHKLILKYISEEGGPYWRHANDINEHKKYDSVCRLLHKFLNRT